MSELNFLQRVSAVQSELKAPKSQYNSFGKYNYRNCEDILEAVKPLLAKNDLILTLTDSLVGIDGRFYVEAQATIYDTLGDLSLTTKAVAREAATKKGMDEAQITGSASSYARKYALSGLLCLDDTRDPDATNDHGSKQAPKESAYEAAKRRLWAAEKKYAEAHGLDPKAIHEGVRKRPDYEESAEFFNLVAEEFETA